ncbi:hypothetical protein [Sphingomonas mollis]|uniref:Uncharacterized protein n=1 Tax=Sphingomonas mollis TaxID=2795726 RepID=A0ABS0XS58_9SPHN|nr:hypothetical protein [Sphingomonas sp. BT553]MBJ6122625.1 hypothetical protein [Sphingomonas sp. BT553]
MRSMFGKISFSALVLAIGVILPSSQSFASENYGVAKMTEPFADPGEQTARAYAMTEELTISEATRRLRLMSEAARLAYQLQVRYPDTVSGVEVVGGRGFRVAVYGVRDAIGAIEKTSREISSSSELGQILDFRSAPTSAAAISASAKLQLAGLRANGIEAVIASNARTGQTKLLVKDSTATLMGLVDGALRATVGTRIEHFDGIFTTATEVPGGQLYDGPTYKCTRGFNVKQINGSLYGISTAGHCDNSGTDGPTGKNTRIQARMDDQWSGQSMVDVFRRSGLPPSSKVLQWNIYDNSYRRKL